jgi:nucleoside-diphosphate-sugar epimerase
MYYIKAKFNTMSKNVLVFGANGKVGNHFISQALEKGYKIKAFVRSPHKFTLADTPNVEVYKGDATNYQDVETALSEVDIVVSCLGNVSKKVLIMEQAYNNILTAAAKQHIPPRCLLISSIGIGGSSRFVKFMLQNIGGKAGFNDYEKAEARARARNEKKVPTVVIRPAGLTDKKAKNNYSIINKPTVFFPKFITRFDVAKFFVDCLENTSFDGKAVMVEGT